MMNQETNKTQTGQIIIILLLIMLVGLSIGLALTQRSVTDVTTSTQVEQSSRAFSAAEAGLEKALTGSIPSGGTVTLGNDSLAQVNQSIALPVAGTFAGIEYPPIGRETTAQFWFIDPVVSGAGEGLSNQIASYWTLDENGASVSDSFGGRTGTVTGTTFINPAKIEGGRQFTNSADITQTAATNLALSDMTFAAWVRPTGLGGVFEAIASQRSSNTGPNAWNIGYTSSYQLHFNAVAPDCSSSYGGINTPTSVLSQNAWNHVVITRNAATGNISFYVNGTMVYSDTTTQPPGSLCNTPIPINFGRFSYDSAQRMVGSLDEVGIWNRVLSETEIGQLNNLTRPATTLANGASYEGTSFDLYFGNPETTDNPAVEVAIIMQSGNNFYSKTYYYDSDPIRSGPGGNGFLAVSPICNSTANLGVGILGSDSKFFCKQTVGPIPNVGGLGDCPGGTCKLILARVRLLYSNENHKIALAPVGAGVQFPPQVQIYNAKGTSGQSQKQIQAFRVKDVVPPWFDFAIFSVNEIIK